MKNLQKMSMQNYTVSHKKQDTKLTDFQNSFTATLSRKFAIKRLLQIPLRLKDVATLPCEMLVFRNCTD